MLRGTPQEPPQTTISTAAISTPTATNIELTSTPSPAVESPPVNSNLQLFLSYCQREGWTVEESIIILAGYVRKILPDIKPDVLEQAATQFVSKLGQQPDLVVNFLFFLLEQRGYPTIPLQTYLDKLAPLIQQEKQRTVPTKPQTNSLQANLKLSSVDSEQIRNYLNCTTPVTGHQVQSYLMNFIATTPDQSFTITVSVINGKEKPYIAISLYQNNVLLTKTVTQKLEKSYGFFHNGQHILLTIIEST